jgi:hypothetical protein
MFVADTAGETTDVPPVRALAAAVDGLLAVDPGGLGDESLAAAMVELRRQQARLAATVALTGVFDARRVWAEDGSRGAADWLAARTRLPKREVAVEVRGRRLGVMPLTRGALRAGEIGVAHARRLSGLAANPRTAADFPAGEPLLVANAATMRFDDFERTCDHWRDAADPDGPEHKLARDHDLRRVHLATGLGGVGHLDGFLTPTGTAIVGGGLERIEQELFEADRAEARARHGDAATGAHLARTPAQRRHDALVELAVRAMTAPADGKRPAPLITIMVGYETFAGRVCELATGTVVAPGVVAGLWGQDDTLIERVVFEGPNRITDLSTARSFRGTIRRVVEVKQRRCGHHSCDVPGHRCQGDHIVAWADGGLTTQDNGQLRCGYHNRWRYHHPDHDPGPHDNPTAGQHWWLETDGEHHVPRRSSRAARGPDEPASPGPSPAGPTADLATTHAWRPIALP